MDKFLTAYGIKILEFYSKYQKTDHAEMLRGFCVYSHDWMIIDIHQSF